MNTTWNGRMATLALAATCAAPAAHAQLNVSIGNPAAAAAAAPSTIASQGGAGAGASGGASQAGAGVGVGMTSGPAAAPSTVSRPSMPSQPGQLPEPVASTRDSRAPASLMNMGSYGGTPATTPADVGAVLNTGAWNARRDISTKICPPGTVNRNNFCAPTPGGVPTR